MLSAGSLFTGIGLLDYGLHLAGLSHAWVCESDEWRREAILARRFPDAVRYDDVRGVGHGCQRVDVIVGGFPCKGASTAGKRTGLAHPETALWLEQARVVGELRPRYVIVENVAHILALHGGAVWGRVLADLAALGYVGSWGCIRAADVGAPHQRDRVFAVAVADADWPRADADAAAGGSWAAVGERDGAVAHAAHIGSERGGRARQRRAGSEDGGQDAPHAARYAEGGPAASSGAEWERAGPRGGQAAPDTGGGRLSQLPPEHGTESARPNPDALGRGVRVEWGDYGPAIRRWEAIHGPAPEPLVRRVDDRGAARVERSRLSALGDGVQVQVGRIVGEFVMALERERRAALVSRPVPEV